MHGLGEKFQNGRIYDLGGFKEESASQEISFPPRSRGSH
jgi:hypothetical protein